MIFSSNQKLLKEDEHKDYMGIRERLKIVKAKGRWERTPRTPNEQIVGDSSSTADSHRRRDKHPDQID